MDRRPPPRPIDDPQPGYFATKLVRHGPLVGARILFTSGLWSAEINGRSCGPAHADTAKAAGVIRVWLSRPITKAEYDRLMGLAKQPGHPAATPLRAIDITKLPPVF